MSPLSRQRRGVLISASFDARLHFISVVWMSTRVNKRSVLSRVEVALITHCGGWWAEYEYLVCKYCWTWPTEFTINQDVIDLLKICHFRQFCLPNLAHLSPDRRNVDSREMSDTNYFQINTNMINVSKSIILCLQLRLPLLWTSYGISSP